MRKFKIYEMVYTYLYLCVAIDSSHQSGIKHWVTFEKKRNTP